ncbi:unnamed protein product, partial [marine sediment metagenome]
YRGIQMGPILGGCPYCSNFLHTFVAQDEPFDAVKGLLIYPSVQLENDC